MTAFNYRVIALDPGGATGWATYSSVLMPDGKHYDEEFTCGTLDHEDHHLDLYGLLGLQHVQNYIVVTESFEFRQNDGDRTGIELISREYIGVAKLFGQERKVKVVKQTASTAKKFMPDKGPMANKHLRVMGLWVPGRENRHAMDAYRHLVYYLVNRERRYDLIESWKNLL